VGIWDKVSERWWLGGRSEVEKKIMSGWALALVTGIIN